MGRTHTLSLLLASSLACAAAGAKFSDRVNDLAACVRPQETTISRLLKEISTTKQEELPIAGYMIFGRASDGLVQVADLVATAFGTVLEVDLALDAELGETEDKPACFKEDVARRLDNAFRANANVDGGVAVIFRGIETLNVVNVSRAEVIWRMLDLEPKIHYPALRSGPVTSAGGRTALFVLFDTEHPTHAAAFSSGQATRDIMGYYSDFMGDLHLARRKRIGVKLPEWDYFYAQLLTTATRFFTVLKRLSPADTKLWKAASRDAACRTWRADAPPPVEVVEARIDASGAATA